MMAAEIVIIILELNWAGEKKEAVFLFFGFFFYPQYLLSKIAFQVNSW